MIWRDIFSVGFFALAIVSLADRDPKRSSQANYLGVELVPDVEHGVRADSVNVSDSLPAVKVSSLAEVGHNEAAAKARSANGGSAQRANYRVLSSGHMIQQKAHKRHQLEDAPQHDVPDKHVEDAAQRTAGASPSSPAAPVTEAPKEGDATLTADEASLNPLQMKALEVVAKDEVFAEQGDPLIEDGMNTMSSVLSDPRNFLVQLPGMKDWMVELKRAIETQPQEQQGMCLSHGEYRGYGCYKADKKLANICTCRGRLEMCVTEDDESKIAALVVEKKKAEALKLAKSMLLGECRTPAWVYVSIFVVCCVTCVVGGFLMMWILSRRKGPKPVAKPSSLPDPPKSLEIKKHESALQRIIAAGTEAFASAWNNTVDAVRSVIVSKRGSDYTVAD